MNSKFEEAVSKVPLRHEMSRIQLSEDKIGIADQVRNDN
jgi:hypothetical protein